MPSPVLKNRALLTFMSGHFSNDLLVGVLPVLYPIFKDNFGLDNARLGFVTLAYSIASSATQPFFGYASDRVRKWWFQPIIILWAGIFVGLYGFAANFWEIFIFAILAGLGSAAFHPLGAMNAAGSVHDSHLNTSMSIYTVAGSTGYAIGPLVAVGFTGLFGIRGTACFTAVTVVAAALMFNQLRELNATNSLNLGRAVRAAQTSLPPVDVRTLTLLIATIMLRSWSFLAIQQFTPVWYDSLGHSRTFYGALVTTMTLFAALGTLTGGWLADRTGGRVVVVGSIFATIPFMLLYAQFPGVVGFATGGIYGFLSDSAAAIALLSAQRLMPGRTGVASSMVLGLGFVSGGLGVPVVGRVIDSIGYSEALTLLVFVNLAAALIAVSIPANVWGVRRAVPTGEHAASPA